MDATITVALLSMAGTTIGSVAGILTANRLTNYRIEQLEKKVDKHNGLAEKMTRTEGELVRIEEKFDEKVSVANHRIADLEHPQKGEL
jgi:gas vesicle protein